jgi:multidrug efflux pump subunit AcrA (membrane-fusion protein)
MPARQLVHLGLALLAGIAAGCKRAPPAISGTIESRRVDVGAELSARLEKLLAREGDRVAAGQLLAQLECAQPQADLAAGRARLSEAEAELELLRAGARKQETDIARAALATAQANLELAHQGARPERIAQLQARLDELDARIHLATLSHERALSLLQSGPGTQAAVDQSASELEAQRAERARTEAELAEAKLPARDEQIRALEGIVAQAAAQLDLLLAGARPERIAAAQAAVDAARAGLAGLESRAGKCRLTAPVSGLLEIVDYEEGEIVPQGALVFAIAKDGPLRVRTFAPQSVLERLKVNDSIALTVDGHPEQRLSARVERIADQAEFTGGNVQTPEDRMLLVFRVDLELEPSEQPPLRPGMHVLVEFTAP